MIKKINIRIILDVFILISIAIFPWWFTIILIIAGLYLFKNFYESFFFAVMVDSVYSIPREIFFEISCVSLLFVTVLFFFIEGFKKRLRI